MPSLTRIFVFTPLSVMLCACTGAPAITPLPKESCAEGEDCGVSVRPYEQETLPDITDIAMDRSATPSGIPKPSETPIDKTEGARGTSLQSCAKAEVGLATDKAKDFLLGKGMELASKLPGVFSDWAKKGEKFGGGTVGSIDLAAGLSLRVELVSTGASPGTRWVFLIVTSQEDSATSITPVPTQASGGDGSYTFIIRAEQFDAATGQWVAVCEDTVTPPEVPTVSPEGATPSTGPTVQVLINARCRLGPLLDYPVLAFFSQGDVLHPTGRNQDATWCQVPVDAGPGACWLAGNLTEPNCALLDLPYAPAPPLPAATSTLIPVNQNPQQQGCFYNQKCHHWVCGPNDPPNAVSCSY
jgi:hypothetical protein